MKISPLLCFLGCFGTVSAQYFSAGWSPDQPVEWETEPNPSAPDASSPTGRIAFDWKSIFNSGPIASVLSRLGINITEKLAESGTASHLWDNRIPLITDENFSEMIVNEPLTPAEEAKRMWFLVITVTAARQEGVSKYLDDVFDAAYNESELAGGINGVRWGRIDYLNVTYLTTKWAIWQAPYLVFLTDRGKTLRFLKGTRLRLQTDVMLDYLRAGHWKDLEPWTSAYSPGGSREWQMDAFALATTKIYNLVTKVPRLVLLILSGTIGTFIISLLHKSPKPSPKPVTAGKPVEPVKPSLPPVEAPPAAPGPSQTTRRTSTRQRKAAKK